MRNNKIIIICVSAFVLLVGSIVGGIFIFKGIANSKIKKELEENKNQANEVFNDYVENLLTKNNTIVSSDLYGYIFIIENGEGVSDYLFSVGKNGKLENGQKLNFNSTNFTITDTDNKEILIFAPDGNQYSLSKFKRVNLEEFSNNSNIFIFYGDTSMGFFDKQGDPDPEEPENQGNTELENLNSMKEIANTELIYYFNNIKDLATQDEISNIEDLVGYVFIVECGNGFSDYMFIVKSDGTLDDGLKVNFTSTYIFREDRYECLVTDSEGNNILVTSPNQTSHTINEYTMDNFIQKNNLSVNTFFGSQEMGFNIFIEDLPEEELPPIE
ncbi:MAG: hypothetical protein IJW82_06065 [Clostridia bacterium]|nr:hypothetical protein [Clostridia bacterium]